MLGWVKGEILAAAPPNSHLIAEVIFHSSICSYEVRKKTYETNKIQINLHTQIFFTKRELLIFHRWVTHMVFYCKIVKYVYHAYC